MSVNTLWSFMFCIQQRIREWLKKTRWKKKLKWSNSGHLKSMLRLPKLLPLLKNFNTHTLLKKAAPVLLGNTKSKVSYHYPSLQSLYKIILKCYYTTKKNKIKGLLQINKSENRSRVMTNSIHTSGTVKRKRLSSKNKK